MMRRQVGSLAALAWLAAFSAATVAQEPSLEPVLARASKYVDEFRVRLSAIVAEEVSVQDFRPAPGSSVDVFGGRLGQVITHRELRSDFLLVRPADGGRYIDFRDVFEVDGKPVRDREQRLERLFLKPQPGSAEQLELIVADSARFNIGNVVRTVNTPTLALVFLEVDQQPRFRFARIDRAQPALIRGGVAQAISSRPDVWTIEYREVARNTIVRRSVGNGDLPAHGRLWIDAPSGRVLMTELVIDDPLTPVTIDVVYGSEPVAELLVPLEMRERYENRTSRSMIEVRSTYSRFRKFQVGVEEQIVK